MRVWICIAYDPLPGVDRTTRLLRYGTLAEMLAAAGHEVVFWTSTLDHWRKTQRFGEDRTVKVRQGLTIELLWAPGYRRNVSVARIRHNRALAAKFAVRTEGMPNPDVIFASIPCLELAEAAANYARNRGIPFVADVQDVWPEVYLSVIPGVLRPFARLLLATEFARARRIFRSAVGITAVSQEYLAWAQGIRGHAGSADRVFHLGYRLPPGEVLERTRAKASEFRTRHRLPESAVVATFLGQFAASYDIRSLVGAAHLLAKWNAPVHIVLAGTGDKLQAARSAARDISNVTFTGWLEYEETIALLQLSDIGLAAYSRRAPQSLPYKPFEYMAFGLPVISSLRGELRSLIERHGIGAYYSAGDAHSLANAIVDLATSPRLAACGENAYRLYASEFDGGLITSRLIDYLSGARAAESSK